MDLDEYLYVSLSIPVPIGTALLHLATWTYLSGNLKRREFKPIISGSENFLIEHLEKNYFASLGLNFRFEETYPGGGNLILAEKGGLIGRLIHAMGVTYPVGDFRKRMRKPYQNHQLPHYFWDILNSNADGNMEAEQKKFLLKAILKIIFTDRLKTDVPKKGIYIQLNTHSSKNEAIEYGNFAVRFFNGTLAYQNCERIFSESQIRVNANANLYDCKLAIKPPQMIYLYQTALS